MELFALTFTIVPGTCGDYSQARELVDGVCDAISLLGSSPE
jgi:hypothetical protein